HQADSASGEVEWTRSTKDERGRGKNTRDEIDNGGEQTAKTTAVKVTSEGEQQIAKGEWVKLKAMVNSEGETGEQELAKTSIIKGKYCELWYSTDCSLADTKSSRLKNFL
ncbi:hypothetical protein PAXRUDRAFT_171817, partial [Paxillus rubicundulus Ve08.2h10]